MITSLQNKRVKEAIKLRDRRGRDRQGRILIDGLREIERGLNAGVTILEAFVCHSLGMPAEQKELQAQLELAKVELLEVNNPVWEKLTFGKRRGGILAVASPPDTTLGRIELPGSKSNPGPLVVVLDSVEKPGNIGAVVRSVDAVGGHAVILSDPKTDVFNPNAIRASVGTVFKVPMAVASVTATQRWLAENQFQTLAARVGQGPCYTSVDLTKPTAIVMGNEAQGLGPDWQGDQVRPIQIPMNGLADSLNVSIATAVVLYEALRQRS